MRIRIFNDDFDKELQKLWDEELNRIKLVKMSISDPYRYYAIYNMDTGEVQYAKKEKPSNKRIVLIKSVRRIK